MMAEIFYFILGAWFVWTIAEIVLESLCSFAVWAMGLLDRFLGVTK